MATIRTPVASGMRFASIRCNYATSWFNSLVHEMHGAVLRQSNDSRTLGIARIPTSGTNTKFAEQAQATHSKWCCSSSEAIIDDWQCVLGFLKKSFQNVSTYVSNKFDYVGVLCGSSKFPSKSACTVERRWFYRLSWTKYPDVMTASRVWKLRGHTVELGLISYIKINADTGGSPGFQCAFFTHW